MWVIFLFGLVLASTSGQYVKSRVKGGYGSHGFQDNINDNIARFYNNSSSHNFQSQSQTVNVASEVGVCFIEVPTAQLVDDKKNVPKGNGSRPDLSLIRSCCKGYIQNIYNPNICEPHCTNPCVNALCTAPDTCTCFPDHVKNAGGFCVATCPIGCQNGNCVGRECVCRDGFRLDYERKYCVPLCNNNCGGVGNCTYPNHCECGPGYQSTPDGSCRPTGLSASGIRLPGPNTQIPTSNYPGNHGYNNIQNSSYPYNRPQIPHTGQQPNYIVNPSTGTAYPSSDNQLVNTSYNGLYPSRALQQLNNSYQQPQSQYPLPNQPQYPWQQNPYQNPNSTLPNQNNPSNGYPYQSQYPGQSPVQRPIYPGQNQTSSAPLYPHQSYPYPNPLQPTYPGQIPNNNRNPDGFLDLSNRTYPGQVFPPQQGYYPYPLYTPMNQQGSVQPMYHQQGSMQNMYPNQGSVQPMYPQQGSGQQNLSNYGYNGQQATTSEFSQTYHGQSNLEGPQCSQPCLNGVCVEGNRCTCNSGYVNDNMDVTGFTCKPYCAGGCPNGICSAPNFCICNMGYRKDSSVKGRPVCVKQIR